MQRPPRSAGLQQHLSAPGRCTSAPAPCAPSFVWVPGSRSTAGAMCCRSMWRAGAGRVRPPPERVGEGGFRGWGTGMDLAGQLLHRGAARGLALLGATERVKAAARRRQVEHTSNSYAPYSLIRGERGVQRFVLAMGMSSSFGVAALWGDAAAGTPPFIPLPPPPKARTTQHVPRPRATSHTIAPSCTEPPPDQDRSLHCANPLLD